MPDATNYEDILTISQTTLPKSLGTPGEPHKLINECSRHAYIAGRLLRRIKMDWDGGITIRWPLQFNRSRVGGWTHPHNKRALGGTKAPTWGSAPIRFYSFGWFKPYAELDLNKGAKQVLIDLGKLARSDVSLDLVESLEDAVLAADGNYAHDGTGDDFMLPFGLRYVLTIDGLHIAEAGATTPARSVYGINPGTYPAHRNPYVNPVGSSDGLGPITSVYELREAIERMFTELSFDSLDVWGKAASDFDAEGAVDYDSKETPKDLMMVTDRGTYTRLRRILFDREDNVGYDQYRPRPVFHGVEVRYSDSFGIDSTYGWGFDSDGNALWTDRTGDYASAQWKGHGEMMILNTRYLHLAVHPQHAPLQAKPYRPEGMMGIGHEGDFWKQLICRSRRRAGAYIGPYPLDLAA